VLDKEHFLGTESTYMATQTLTPLPHRRPLKIRRIRSANGLSASAAASTLIRLVVLVGAATGVAVALPASASADPLSSSVLNDVGIGPGGTISQAIAQIGTSLCPMLVQPGSQMASTATTASGNGGLGSQLAGGVAGLVIQSQCPSFMTSLANGDFSVLTNAASMLGMATPGGNPLSSLSGAAGSPLGGLTVPGG
jgi:hypothetical protein